MSETFQIIPATARSSALLWGIGALVLVLLLGVTLLLGGSLRASRFATFVVSPEDFGSEGELIYRSFVPAASLLTQEARVVNLEEDSGLRPVARTAGTGLPGYAGGWFRLADGSKALVYLTDHRRVVHIPTSEGFSVLLSVTEPEQMLQRLREVGGR